MLAVAEAAGGGHHLGHELLEGGPGDCPRVGRELVPGGPVMAPGHEDTSVSASSPARRAVSTSAGRSARARRSRSVMAATIVPAVR